MFFLTLFQFLSLEYSEPFPYQLSSNSMSLTHLTLAIIFVTSILTLRALASLLIPLYFNALNPPSPLLSLLCEACSF